MKDLPRVSEIIENKLLESLLPNTEFKPTSEFYLKVGINKHRFAKILRDEIEPTRKEIKSISMYFNIDTKMFFQLKNN